VKGDLSGRSPAHPAVHSVRSRPPDETTASDVAYFRSLVARLEAGGEDLWDLPCARLALAAIERRYEEIRAARSGEDEP
jgi:hypothetical protein